jgi:hypothetical protein
MSKTSLPGRTEDGLSRFGSIGRETLVVVAVSGLAAAVALLPRVAGESTGEHFALPRMPAAKGASVTAPIFGAPTRAPKHPDRPAVLTFVQRPVLVVSAPVASTPPQQILVARPARPAATPTRAASVRPQPAPVAHAPSQPAATPVTAVVPQPAAPQPAITVTPITPATAPVTPPAIAQPVFTPITVVAPQPAIVATPTDQGTVAVIRATVSARAPAAAVQQSSSSPLADGKSHGQGHDKQHKNDQPVGSGNDIGAVQATPAASSPQQPVAIAIPDGTSSLTLAAAPPDVSAPIASPGYATPQPPDPQQSALPSAASTDTSSHHHDDGSADSQGHGKKWN